MSTRPRHRWTPADDAQIHTLVNSFPFREIAKRMGMTAAQVKSRAKLIGAKRNTRNVEPWSPADDGFLRKHWGQTPRAEIARRLGRGMSSCDARADTLGLRRRRVHLTPPREARVRELHALGWSDAEIAGDLGCERHTIGDWRKLWGLGHNTHSPHRRRQVAARTRRQLKDAGLHSMAELRLKRWAQRARELGWPDDLGPRHLQILHHLYHTGPATRRELAEAIGMPWKGSRASLHSNDPEGSYLAHLQARGLVVNLGRIHKGKGIGRSTCVYSVPLHVQPQPQPKEQRDAA